MNSLYCNCRNIIIDSDNFLEDVENTVPDYNILFTKEILPKDSYKTYLKNCTLTLQNDFLSQSTQIGDWLVTMCLNCSMITHAISILSSNNNIKSDELKLNDEFIIIASDLIKVEDGQFCENKSYSQLFNILLQEPNDPHIITSDSNSSETITNLQKIQEKFDLFLIQEHDRLEDRIKKYEEDERANFEKLKEKVRLEKIAIISTYISSCKLNILSKFKFNDDSWSQVVPSYPANQMKILPPSNKFKHNISDVILEETSETEIDDQSYQITSVDSVEKLPIKLDVGGEIKKVAYIGEEVVKEKDYKLPQSSMSGLNRNNQNIDNQLDVEDVFNNEIDSSYKQPFSESEESDGLDSCTEDEGITSEKDFSSYSTSVPIHIPFQKQFSNKSQASDSSNTFDCDGANEQMMAASIQALARSVSTNYALDIFGELPKSRTRKSQLTSIGSTEDD